MVKSKCRRLLSLLVALALSCSFLGTGALARDTDFFSAWPETVDFAALSYGDADASAFYALVDALEQAAGTAGKEWEIADLLEQMGEAWIGLNTEYTVCTVAYYKDPAAHARDYVAWSKLLTEVQSAYLKAEKTLLRSDYGPMIAKAWGSDVNSLLSELSPESGEQLALLARDQELVNDYWTAITANYSVTYQGRTWNAAAAGADKSLSAVDRQAIEDLLYKAMNGKTAAILVKMVEERNAYAKTKGYANYAEYAYGAVYARDYSLSDAKALYAQVKKYIAPLYNGMTLSMSYNDELDSAALDPYTGNLTQEQMLDLVEPYMERVSSEYAELFAYMRYGNLADIGPSDSKLSVGFTTALPAYGSAVMFNRPNGSYYDISTLTHEFGHYAEYCLSGDAGDGSSCMDVAEMDSQMLELLYLNFADEMFPEAEDAYRANVLANILSAVVTGCLFDEFQSTLYAQGGMTVDEMNALAAKLAGEYGLSSMYGGDPAYAWVQVNHTFESPMYYMSYATSALSALELFLDAQSDFDTAADTYLRMVARGTGMGYRAAARSAGLSDIFQAGTVASLSGGVLDYLSGTVYDLPAFDDLEHHWAANAAVTCASIGLFQGDSAGAFRPDADMTRAELVTTLWRMAGEPARQADPDYADVPDGVWYTDAVAWASEQGIAAGTGGGFAPRGLMSREQLAVMLYRYLGGGEKERGSSGALDAFSDADRVDAWAVQAMDWAVETGLLTGKPGGLLDPLGSVTRGEAATLLERLLQAA